MIQRSVLGVSINFVLILQAANAAYIRYFEGNAPTVPSNVDDLVVENVWQGDMTNMAEVMTHLQWVPGSDMVVTGHKHGVIRLYPSIASGIDDFVELIDMRQDVDSEGDHGLLGFQFHPEYQNGVNTAFVLYTGNPKDVTLLPNNDVVSPLRDEGWGTNFLEQGYEWPYDLCTDLGANNEDGHICEKVYYIDRVIVNLDGDVPSMTKDITFFEGACGSSSTHGPGTILEINGDLVFSMGDGSQYDLFDYGFEDLDACFVPDNSIDQGCFRSQRDDFPNGKVMRIPANLLVSEEPITLKDLTIISKGNRQPFRMFYHEEADKLYIADVGFGDWGNTERIFMAPNISEFAKDGVSFNWGWPCLEGMHSNYKDLMNGVYNPFDSPSEQERRSYLEDNDLKTCTGVYTAVENIMEGVAEPSADADPGFRAPILEYRNDVLDPDYPTLCGMTNAAVTSVFVYEGDALPELYRGKLMFADHVKKCVWFFDNDEDGNPDMTSNPHILLTNTDVIDIQQGPDGAVYFVDYAFARVLRMFEYGKGPSAGTDTPPPTIAPTAAPFALPIDIPQALTCFDPKQMPELPWTRNEDGSYHGELTIGAVIYTTKEGTTRTRGFNGMIPGPLMRMKACGVYHLDVYNDMADWPLGFDGDGATNTLHDPTRTSLHLHGLHVSGESPGDDVFIVIEPGEMNQYVYTIPCDHAGGTHFYHPHHHGSTALETDAGAAGLLIIESSAREASGMPLGIQAMPEQYIIMQEMNPLDTTLYAAESGDRLYATDAVDPYILVNGCEIAAKITIEAGQWTRLRMLNVGQEFNSLVSIVATTNGADECEVGLLARDGVWVAEVPRALPDNQLFFSLSSRVDIAIRCNGVDMVHTITSIHLGEQGIETPAEIATITTVESFRKVAGDLETWEPCRPAYLTDLSDTDKVGDSFNLEVRDGLNTLLFSGPDDYIIETNLNEWRMWIISNSDMHPFHIHVNHMQLGEIDESNQWAEINTWNVAGDWIDTISLPGAVPVNIRPERFTGHMVMHCHIAQHADFGILGVALINGDGDGGDGGPEVADYGTCTEEIPKSSSYNDRSFIIPGVIEAEEFDDGGEGIGYHNINIDRNIGSAMRFDEAVEIDALEDRYWVAYIRDGEWLQYSIAVEKTGYYTVILTCASDNVPAGMKWSMWLDAISACPSPDSEGNLINVNDDTYKGTGSTIEFDDYTADDVIELAQGKHTLMLCFEGADAGINLDSIEFEYCGETPEDCNRRKLKFQAQNAFYTITADGEVLN